MQCRVFLALMEKFAELTVMLIKAGSSSLSTGISALEDPTGKKRSGEQAKRGKILPRESDFMTFTTHYGIE